MARFVSLLSVLAAPVLACGWDYETFISETGSLPCVEAVAVMRPARHSPTLLQRKLEVAELALAMMPTSLPAYDAKTNALLHLKKLDLALVSARARAALAPDDYGSSANLGTVLTFTGDLEEALKHVERTLAKDPNAHFGREQFHAQLLRYLIELKRDPTVATKRDFLGLTLSDTDVLGPKGAKGRAEGRAHSGDTTPEPPPSQVPPRAKEALLSMLGVYGASENPHVLYALGNVLALEGDRKLAFSAWKSALEQKHPAVKVVQLWMESINVAAHDAAKPELKYKNDPIMRSTQRGDPLTEAHWRFEDRYAGLWSSANEQQRQWEGRQALAAQYEEAQLKLGLAHWTEAGMQVLVTQQRRLGLRCPGLDAPQTLSGPSLFSLPAKPGTVTEAARLWLLALEERVSAVRDARSCEQIRPEVTAKLTSAPLPRTDVKDRQSLLADVATRERFFEVFDRLALVLSKCPAKGGNGPVLEKWVKQLTP